MIRSNQTREQWLVALAVKLVPEIEARTLNPLPRYRVTCGFPSKGGLMGGKTRTRGQCWSAEASEDRHAEIFISPVEDEAETVAAILCHELIHASLPKAGHGPAFQKAARAMGHEKPFTTAYPTGAFWAWVRPLLEAAPPYPHRRLNAMQPVAAPKKQKGRLLKAECGTCGYVVRVARRWIEDAGAPLCPRHGAMGVELPD